VARQPNLLSLFGSENPDEIVSTLTSIVERRPEDPAMRALANAWGLRPGAAESLMARRDQFAHEGSRRTLARREADAVVAVAALLDGDLVSMQGRDVLATPGGSDEYARAMRLLAAARESGYSLRDAAALFAGVADAVQADVAVSAPVVIPPLQLVRQLETGADSEGA
jgi:hypothetical protein